MGYYLWCFVLLFLTAVECSNDKEEEAAKPISEKYEPPTGTSILPMTAQRNGGNPSDGWAYLVHEDYVGGGIPYEFFSAFQPQQGQNLLGRKGESASVPYLFNLSTTEMGVKILSGNCFTCHAGKLNGDFVVGLGNSLSDFTDNQGGMFSVAEAILLTRYGADSPQWQAYSSFGRGSKVVAPYTVMPFRGVNPAFMIEQAAVAHHDPHTLAWLETPYYEIPKAVIGSDVPPLWNVKKKNALYYNGMGRGDFTKALMQVASVAVSDTAQARKINDNFVDVLAWINTLEAPAYPEAIDKSLAAEGKMVFRQKCQKCHGTYGDKAFYPNLLVQLDKVRTDPYYANYFLKYPGFTEAANDSWYSEGPTPLRAVPSKGYVAPPLDGIWATAPYLHNGSVPTLQDLLNSEQRPTFWRRTFEDKDYDFEKVGWKYTVEEGSLDKQTYDTTIEGYGNQGHTFGDKLTTPQRTALIEYLKTL